jgi:hypothetical protein
MFTKCEFLVGVKTLNATLFFVEAIEPNLLVRMRVF